MYLCHRSCYPISLNNSWGQIFLSLPLLFCFVFSQRGRLHLQEALQNYFKGAFISLRLVFEEILLVFDISAKWIILLITIYISILLCSCKQSYNQSSAERSPHTNQIFCVTQQYTSQLPNGQSTRAFLHCFFFVFRNIGLYIRLVACVNENFSWCAHDQLSPKLEGSGNRPKSAILMT